MNVRGPIPVNFINHTVGTVFFFYLLGCFTEYHTFMFSISILFLPLIHTQIKQRRKVSSGNHGFNFTDISVQGSSLSPLPLHTSQQQKRFHVSYSYDKFVLGSNIHLTV